jgi:Fur family ferric uptake transcriptional regulator
MAARSRCVCYDRPDDMPTRKPPTPRSDRQRLHDAGLRATPARLRVLGVLRRARGSMSHAEVADALEGQPWDRATIFRNLVTLVDAGLAMRTDVGDRVWRFSVPLSGVSEPVDHKHPHLVCTSCGTLSCIRGVDLRMERGARLPKSVRDRAVEVQLRGLCDACV